jgi:NAD-dependent SIR2 family protein deacetylase
VQCLCRAGPDFYRELRQSRVLADNQVKPNVIFFGETLPPAVKDES